MQVILLDAHFLKSMKPILKVYCLQTLLRKTSALSSSVWKDFWFMFAVHSLNVAIMLKIKTGEESQPVKEE